MVKKKKNSTKKNGLMFFSVAVHTQSFFKKNLVHLTYNLNFP